ncbi:DDE Tnp4 domain-containing protein [Aphis craccivora]|uniref:DDE Tnp4 domain-containing protein n=1 Tax=Aphis craccivora TaxID=307492 RepID=A0A6G0Z6N3_APHCR|nr:DDE Tnp4 domain-containing protein [Aphis craccivora]
MVLRWQIIVVQYFRTKRRSSVDRTSTFFYLQRNPQIINLDFEKATLHVIQCVFGEHVHIQGCFYHLSQNTYRKIQEVGFQAKYKTDEIH